jgi:rod shape-determining protein MreD
VIYLIALAVAGVLAIFHVSFMQYIEVLGVTPDLLLIFAACFAVLRSQDEALVVVPMCGFLRDLTTSDPIGTSILGFAPIVLLAAVAHLRAMDSQFIPAVAVTFLGSISYTLVSMLVLGFTGQEIEPWPAIFRLALPLAVVNALFTPAVYMPVSWFRAPFRPRVLGPGRIRSKPV